MNIKRRHLNRKLRDLRLNNKTIIEVFLLKSQKFLQPFLINCYRGQDASVVRIFQREEELLTILLEFAGFYDINQE
jgi:hypothetical protein